VWGAPGNSPVGLDRHVRNRDTRTCEAPLAFA